jgi:hypothetical protein
MSGPHRSAHLPGSAANSRSARSAQVLTFTTFYAREEERLILYRGPVNVRTCADRTQKRGVRP